MCRNDELSSTMSWVGCLLKDSEFFILFSENSQILLKISVIPIRDLNFLNLLVHKQPIQLIIAVEIRNSLWDLQMLSQKNQPKFIHLNGFLNSFQSFQEINPGFAPLVEIWALENGKIFNFVYYLPK